MVVEVGSKCTSLSIVRVVMKLTLKYLLDLYSTKEECARVMNRWRTYNQTIGHNTPQLIENSQLIGRFRKGHSTFVPR